MRRFASTDESVAEVDVSHAIDHPFVARARRRTRASSRLRVVARGVDAPGTDAKDDARAFESRADEVDARGGLYTRVFLDTQGPSRTRGFFYDTTARPSRRIGGSSLVKTCRGTRRGVHTRRASDRPKGARPVRAVSSGE